MRRNLKRHEGETRVFYGLMGSVNCEGRLLFKDVVMLDEAGNRILNRTDHINTSLKQFKGKNLKHGDYVRFTGKTFEYERQNGTKDYSIRPSYTNVRKMRSDEILKYKNFLKNKVKNIRKENLILSNKSIIEKYKWAPLIRCSFLISS